MRINVEFELTYDFYDAGYGEDLIIELKTPDDTYGEFIPVASVWIPLKELKEKLDAIT